MLEPLVATSLAGNIVNFVDFSAKVVHRTKQLGSSSLPADLAATRGICNDLISSLQRALVTLRPTVRADVPTALDSELLELVSDALEELVEFRGKLDLLSLQNDSHVWKRFRRAVKIAWQGSALKDLQLTLDRYQAAYSRHLVESNSLGIADIRDGLSLMRDEQRGIANSQRSLETHLTNTSTCLDQLSSTVMSGFDDAARKQDRISNSLVLLHNTQHSLTDGQNQITNELATSAGRENEILTAILNARDIMVEARSTSMAHMRSQETSHQYIRQATDAHSDILERLYQTLDAMKAQHQERNGAPEASLHLKLRLPLTRSMMELTIRPAHNAPYNGIASDVLLHRYHNMLLHGYQHFFSVAALLMQNPFNDELLVIVRKYPIGISDMHDRLIKDAQGNYSKPSSHPSKVVHDRHFTDPTPVPLSFTAWTFMIEIWAFTTSLVGAFLSITGNAFSSLLDCFRAYEPPPGYQPYSNYRAPEWLYRDEWMVHYHSSSTTDGQHYATITGCGNARIGGY